MSVVSVSVPDGLLQQADQFIKRRGLAGRSGLVRAALQDYLRREKDAERSATQAATLTLVYPEGFERKVGHVRHEFVDVVQSMMHGHTQDHCVEVFVLRGPADRIRGFADALRGIRETHLVSVTFADAAPSAG